MNKLFTKIVGVALGASMAVGMGVAVANNRDVAPAHASLELSYDVDLSKASAISSRTPTGSFSYTTEYTLTMASGSRVFKAYGFNPNNYAVAGTRFGNKNTGTTMKNLTNGPTTGSNYVQYISTNASISDSITKVEITTLADFGSCTKGTGYVQVSSKSDFSSSTNYSFTHAANSTIPITITSPNANRYYRIVWQKASSSSNAGIIVSHIKFYYEGSIPTTSVAVSPESVTLAPGETQQLTTTVLPANTTDTLTYSSSAAGVATVTSSGLIHAVADGTATITATSGNYSDTCVVTVETPTTPFITPNKTSTSGYTGCNETIGFIYGNLTNLGVSTSGATVSASIENDDGESADVVITFNTATASDSYVYLKDGSTTLATITVTSITASTVTITGLAAEATCYSNETLNLGSTITVTATGSMSSNVSWESDDEDVATVSAAGVVTPVALGTANITVTSDDYSSATMTCKVTVESAPQKYVIDGPDNDSASQALTLANLKTYYPTTNMEVEWTAVSGSIYGTSTQAMRVGTGSATGSATLSLVDNASIYVTKIVVNVKNYGSDSSTFVVNGDVTTNTAKSATTTATDYEFKFASTDTTFTIQNVSKRIYVYRVDVYYSYKAAELSASPSSFDLAVSTSQAVTLAPKNFTPSSYSATVKSGTSLTTDSVEFSGNIATITAGVSTGITVLTITGTEGLRKASVDITVDVTQPRNLITLTITTSSDATTFKVGQTFDVGSLVITGTFDSAPTTVIYSKAQGNMALLTALPEIGYEFGESDIGTVTSAEFELTVGTGTKSVSYPINVIDKDYAGAVTSIDNLWDGQHVYFSNGTNAAFPKYSTGKNVTSVDATINETKGLDIGSTTAFAYTVGRVKIESIVYYTFSFDDGGDTYYIKDAGTSNDNAISKTTDTTDTAIYWTISAGENGGQWHIVNRSNTIKPTLQVNGSYLSCYDNNQTDPYLYAATAYSKEAVAESFKQNALHFADYDPSQSTKGKDTGAGWCKDSEHNYYQNAKNVWNAMTNEERGAVDQDALDRLSAWASANGDVLNGTNVLSTRTSISSLLREGSAVSIVIIVSSAIALTAIGGYFFIRRRKKQY